LKKLKINDNFFNFLTEGKYGNCPPYYIYYNTFNEEYYNIYNKEDNCRIFLRLKN